MKKKQKDEAKDVEVTIKLNGIIWNEIWWKKMSTKRFLKMVDDINDLTDKVKIK